MMKKTCFIMCVVLLSPFVMAWNQEECEAVNWDHVDCRWGGPTEPDKPLETHRNVIGSNYGTVSIWFITLLEFRSTSVCARSYEVKTFPRSNEFRVTGVERFSCLDTDVYLSYPSLLGVYKH